jgi:hypothetical protein
MIMGTTNFESAWNYAIICDTLRRECTNHSEENPMKKSATTTLKLEQKKLLGFRIQGAGQASDAEHSPKIGSKVGNKGEQETGTDHNRKIGAKVGGKGDNKIGAKVGSKPTMVAKIGAKVGSKPV